MCPQVAADEHRDIHAALFHFLLLIETQGLDLRKLVNTAKGAAVLDRILGLAGCDLCYNPFRFATWDALARTSLCSCQTCPLVPCRWFCHESGSVPEMWKTQYMWNKKAHWWLSPA